MPTIKKNGVLPSAAERARYRVLHLADPKRKGSSHFKGVCLKKGRWIAQICVDGSQIYLGSWDSELKAARKFAVFAKKKRLSFGHGVIHDTYDRADCDEDGRLIRE